MPWGWESLHSPHDHSHHAHHWYRCQGVQLYYGASLEQENFERVKVKATSLAIITSTVIVVIWIILQPGYLGADGISIQPREAVLVEFASDAPY